MLVDVQIAFAAVDGLGERIRSNTLYTYRAATKEESLRNHVFTILQPILEAASHNTNDKNQEQQKLKMVAMNAGINGANRRISSLRAWENNGYRRPHLLLCVTQLFQNNLSKKKIHLHCSAIQIQICSTNRQIQKGYITHSLQNGIQN